MAPVFHPNCIIGSFKTIITTAEHAYTCVRIYSTHSKVTEDMVSKIEYFEASPAGHSDEVPHVALNVGLALFQTGHRLPRLVQRPWVKHSEWSAYKYIHVHVQGLTDV